MAGRRRARATSTSTVATVDEESIIFRRERSILKPVDNTEDSDEWDCFVLKDAMVYHRNGTPANLLNVDFEGPFVVRGRLDLDEDQKNRLRGQAKSAKAWIEISKSFKYAIGILEGHEIPILWAQGEAGWYEIVPSDRYAKTYGYMVQAISLNYSVLSQLETDRDRLNELEKAKPKGKRRKYRVQDVNLPIRDLLFRYAVKIGDGATHEEVVQRCKTHAGFLLSQFPKGTGFHNWLKIEYPEIVHKLENKDAALASSTDIEPAFIPIFPRPQSISIEGPDIKGKGRAVERASVQRSTRSSEQAEAGVVDLTSEDSHSQRAKAAKAKHKSPSHLKFVVSEQQDVEMRDFAQGPLPLPVPKVSTGPSNSAADVQPGLPTLIAVLNELRATALEELKFGKNKKHPNQLTASSWMTKVYMTCRVKDYQGKLEIFKYFVADLARELGPEWHQSDLYKWVKQNVKTKPTFQYITEQEIVQLIRRQKMPQTTVREGKATADRGKQPAEHSGKQPQKGRPSGKKAGLRPSLGGPIKRLRDEDFDDEMNIDDDLPRRKTAKTSQYFDSDEQVNAAASSEDDGQNSDKGSLIKIVIRAERLPSTTPKGPNKTWTCEELNCEYVVRGADDQDGQDLIRKHFEQHEKEASEEAKERELSKINLAMQESRGHLPINHLLDKIRKATAVQKRDELPINGQAPPQPIKRSLLV